MRLAGNCYYGNLQPSSPVYVFWHMNTKEDVTGNFRKFRSSHLATKMNSVVLPLRQVTTLTVRIKYAQHYGRKNER
jgi:hypothetical protein